MHFKKWKENSSINLIMLKIKRQIPFQIAEIWYNKKRILIFERNVGELVLPVEIVSVLDTDPLNLIWLIPAEETYS